MVTRDAGAVVEKFVRGGGSLEVSQENLETVLEAIARLQAALSSYVLRASWGGHISIDVVSIPGKVYSLVMEPPETAGELWVFTKEPEGEWRLEIAIDDAQERILLREGEGALWRLLWILQNSVSAVYAS
ncbi:MAG: hypothetical protein Q8P39_00740 [Candidatus Yanofskybacteria bacterium]|nr:hypothetical protein [Candidatus Yanofskybacteria bacterium]